MAKSLASNRRCSRVHDVAMNPQIAAVLIAVGGAAIGVAGVVVSVFVAADRTRKQKRGELAASAMSDYVKAVAQSVTVRRLREYAASLSDGEGKEQVTKERLDIQIDRPVELPAPLPTHPNRFKSRLTRPVAIGVRVEPRLHQRLQKHGCGRLGHPIRDRGHTEHSDPTTQRLGNLNRPDRGRKIRSPNSSDSKSCRGCPQDRPRTRRDPAHPRQGRPC